MAGASEAPGIRILYVSDTHGRVFPVDYATGRTAPGGLLSFAAQIQAQHDANTLVIDGGDSLQGTPLMQTYLADPQRWLANPAAAAFNAARVDYFTLGNHDFNFGYEPLAAYLRAMNGTCVCANVEDERGELRLRRSAIHTLGNGLRVGITGAVTDWVNVWESSHGGPKGVRVTDPFEALSRECDSLLPLCDVCVCVYHGGFEDDLASGAPLETSGENVGCRIARELGFDLVLTAHQHREVEGVRIGNAWCVQPGCTARKYLEIEGRLADADGGASVQGGPRMVWSSHFEQIGVTHTDLPYCVALRPLEEQTQRELDEPIGELACEIPAKSMLESALEGNPMADLINAAQLAAVRAGGIEGCTLSCTALANEPVGMPAHVTRRDVVAAYQFENALCVMEMSGDDVRQILERCAAYFALSEDGAIQVAREFVEPKKQHFNHDYYAGLDVELDVSRPVGERVVGLRLMDGTPVDPNGTYHMCMNDYRATGTGGYDCLRHCRTVWTSSGSIPDIIAAYVAGNSPVELAPLGKMTIRK